MSSRDTSGGTEMADSYDLTSEIRDDVRALRRDLQDGIRRMEDTRVHREVYEGLVERVEDLEGANTWLYRLVFGAIILAAFDLVMSSPIAGG